jgi:hypothetical protein
MPSESGSVSANRYRSRCISQTTSTASRTNACDASTLALGGGSAFGLDALQQLDRGQVGGAACKGCD